MAIARDVASDGQGRGGGGEEAVGVGEGDLQWNGCI